MIKALNHYFVEDFLNTYFCSYHNSKKGKILDLGCGEQPYRRMYEKYFSEIITADVEIRNGNTDVILETDFLPFEDLFFDVILFTEVIEHIADPFKTVSEISRVLKPGGKLLLTWPFNYSLHEMPNDYFRYTEFFMQKLLYKHNLEIAKITRRGNLLSVSHIIFFQIISNINEFIKRIPIIGKVFRPLGFVIDKLIQSANFIHFKVFRKLKTSNPTAVGNNLRGISGSFAQWTPGYCVLAVKK